MKHNDGKIDKWYPIWIDKWLWGSMRHELIITQGDEFIDLRGIFTDLLTLSKKDGGYIRANENTAYPLSQLAGMFCVPVSRLEQCIEICLRPEVHKLTQYPNGILQVNSHDTYDLSKRHKQRMESKYYDMSALEDTVSQNGVLIDNIIQDNTRGEKKKRFSPPNLQEVEKTFLEKNYSISEAEKFFSYYESNGWKIGSTPMVDWVAAAKTWILRDFSSPKKAVDNRPSPKKKPCEFGCGQMLTDQQVVSHPDTCSNFKPVTQGTLNSVNTELAKLAKGWKA